MSYLCVCICVHSGDWTRVLHKLIKSLPLSYSLPPVLGHLFIIISGLKAQETRDFYYSVKVSQYLKYWELDNCSSDFSFVGSHIVIF